MLIGILIATRRMNVGKASLYLGLAGFVMFSAIGLIIGKGGASFDENFSENINIIWFNFIAYLLGGLPAFDIYMLLILFCAPTRPDFST